jgi:hypothetical protein
MRQADYDYIGYKLDMGYHANANNDPVLMETHIDDAMQRITALLKTGELCDVQYADWMHEIDEIRAGVYYNLQGNKCYGHTFDDYGVNDDDDLTPASNL